jgi:acyl-CoA thioesterase
MTLTTLTDALSFTALDDALEAVLSGDFSNGPIEAPPEAGFPFGGLLAALSAGAMRQGLGIDMPLRTLTVQYLAAAKFGEAVRFTPRLLRGGRNVAYAVTEAGQAKGSGHRLTHHASATYGVTAETVARADLTAIPPAREKLDQTRQLVGPMRPRFTQYVDFVFDGGPNILGGNAERAGIERVWMRTNDGLPLDELRLCYLLDALYPPAWTTTKAPPMMTSVDLRYDLLTDPTPDNAPDGWAFFEFRMLDLGGGWTVDDVTCWGSDGTPLAVARQRRRLL